MNSILALFQAGANMSGGGMVAMMTACVLFGVLLFIALLELVILEYFWIKLWRQRVRGESRPATSISSRAA